MSIGKLISQKEGFTAFIPDIFPTSALLEFPAEIIAKSSNCRAINW